MTYTITSELLARSTNSVINQGVSTTETDNTPPAHLFQDVDSELEIVDVNVHALNLHTTTITQNNPASPVYILA